MTESKADTSFSIDEYPFWRQHLSTDFTQVVPAPAPATSAHKPFVVRAVLDAATTRSAPGHHTRPHSRKTLREARTTTVAYLQLTGDCHVQIGDIELLFRAGDFYLAESTRSIRSISGRVEVIAVFFPTSILKRYSENAKPEALRLCGRDGLGQVTAGYYRALLDDASCPSLDRLQALTSCVANLMATLFGGPTRNLEWSRHALRREARNAVAQYIRDHGAEPGLTPETVRARFQFSLRLLNSLLDEYGTSFARLMLEARLDGCSKALACTSGPLTPISEIALQWGFSNTAHFCRVFRERFRMSASEFRALGGIPRLKTQLPLTERRNPLDCGESAISAGRMHGQ